MRGRRTRARRNGTGDGTRQQQVPLTENVPRAVEATARSPPCGGSANGPGKKAQDTKRRFHRHGDARQTAQTHGAAPRVRSESSGSNGEGLPNNTGRASGPRRRIRAPAGGARRRRGPRPTQGRLRGGTTTASARTTKTTTPTPTTRTPTSPTTKSSTPTTTTTTTATTTTTTTTRRGRALPRRRW